MEIRQVINQYRAALQEFSSGNSLPVKEIFSHRDDVSLANPFGPAVLGWKDVSEALDFASSRFKDGEVIAFETLAKYDSPELVTILEIERWKTKISDRDTLSSFVLRVTSTFRFEDHQWKLVHRHADPITTSHPDGPLRAAG